MDALKYPHSCKYCKNCISLNIRRECFCKFNAVVPFNNICKHYEFDPFKYKVKRIRIFNSSKYSEDDFSIEE